MHRRSFLALPGVALLAGCATLPRQTLDRGNAQALRSVAIVTPAIGQPDAPLQQAVGYHFGLIGSLIEEGMRAARRNDLRRVMAEEQLNPPDLLAEAIAARLQQRGLAAFSLAATRPDAEFLAAYPQADQPFDAWLDVVLREFGYVAQSAASEWHPFAHAHVRLVRRADAAVLMQDRVVFNASGAPTPLGGTAPGVSFADDGQHGFATFARLTADRGRAASGLKVALQRTAEGVATLLG